MHKIIPIIFSLLFTVSAIAEENTTFVYPPFNHTWGIVRATPFKLRIFVGNRTKFNDPQGLACVRLLSWDDTTKTEDDDEITAYGVNSGDNCIIYNTSMYALSIYGLDEEHEKLNRPWGIAANKFGDVYVVDSGNSRVLRFFNPGDELELVSIIGGSGQPAGDFIEPRGVAMSASGNLFVTDAALGRISVFDSTGEFVEYWDGFNGPDGIAVTGPIEKNTYYPSDAFAIVIDSMHSRLTKLTLDGEKVAQTDAMRWGAVDPYLAYLTIDYYNQVIVTDRNNGKLYKLDRNLNYITSFGEPGDGDYQFDQPRGISINRYFGQILVAEREGAQYLWVGVDIPQFKTSISIDSTNRNLEVNFYLTEPAIVDLDILDSFDRFVTRIVANRRYHVGVNSVFWGLTLPEVQPLTEGQVLIAEGYDLGAPLPQGTYNVKARFRATYSSRESFEKFMKAGFELK